MLKLLTAIFFGLLLIVGGGTESAQSGDETFKLTAANANFSIMIKFFSQNRNWVWPGATTHYTLNDNGEHDFKLNCQDGEKICYGGSYTADDQTHWGVGFKGDKGCQDCCLTCDNGWHAWNLNDTTTNVCAHCHDGSCQCGVGTPGSVCANHGGNDPTIGCSQQP